MRLLTLERGLCRLEPRASGGAAGPVSGRPNDDEIRFSNQQGFSIAYKLIRPWLDPETLGKIQVPANQVAIDR